MPSKNTTNKNPITISVDVKATPHKVWDAFTDPVSITHWYFASDDWHAPRAENDLRVGGSFSTRMESKDGKVGFDFEGTYSEVRPKELIVYSLGDGREVRTTFSPIGDKIRVQQTFDPEMENSLELQRSGWLSILENFKKFTEK